MAEGGEQARHFVVSQVLLEDAEGFPGQLLFGFDDCAHGDWSQAADAKAACSDGEPG